MLKRGIYNQADSLLDKTGVKPIARVEDGVRIQMGEGPEAYLNVEATEAGRLRIYSPGGVLAVTGRSPNIMEVEVRGHPLLDDLAARERAGQVVRSLRQGVATKVTDQVKSVRGLTHGDLQEIERAVCDALAEVAHDLERTDG